MRRTYAEVRQTRGQSLWLRDRLQWVLTGDGRRVPSERHLLQGPITHEVLLLLRLSVNLLWIAAKQFPIAMLRWGPVHAELQLFVQMLGPVVQTTDVTDPIGWDGRSQTGNHPIRNETLVLETTIIQRIQTAVLGQMMLLDWDTLSKRIPLLLRKHVQLIDLVGLTTTALPLLHMSVNDYTSRTRWMVTHLVRRILQHRKNVIHRSRVPSRIGGRAVAWPMSLYWRG